MDTRSFTIPACNQTMVEEHIEKLNRRCAKLALDTITLVWGKAFIDKNNTLFLPCQLTGPLSVNYAGWQFVATLQHLPTGENIIRCISEEFVVPLEYRSSGSDCQHCMSKRYRKDTYVVRHESGLYRQVGSTCIKDFLGGNSPDNIMKKANLVGELLSFMDGAGSGPTGNDEGIFHMVTFLAQTAAVIRDHGWISKTKAYEAGSTSTASRVQDNLRPPMGGKFVPSRVTDEDRELAKNAAEWAENISDDDAEINEYLYNIRAIARSGMVGWRTIGYAASIVPSFQRENKKPVSVSNWVGTIKVRENFDLSLQKIDTGVSSFGEYFRYTFHDPHGNIVVWTASYDMGLLMNKPYQIRGTVKAHSEWKGIRRTEINRCEVLTVYGDAS